MSELIIRRVYAYPSVLTLIKLFELVESNILVKYFVSGVFNK